MMPDKAPLVTVVPDTEILDDLELLRNGVLGRQWVGPEELVTVPLTGVDLPARARTAQLTDPEGVPLAQVSITTVPGGPPAVRGAPTWQARRSARPFEELHLCPDQVGPAGTVVLTDRVVAADNLAGRLGPGPLRVLALASTDDADPGAVAVVRSAQAVAAAHDADVVVVPLHPGASRRAEKLRHVREAYARDAALVDLTGPPVPPPESGGVVIFFTGLSGSGKSTIARSVRNRLVEQGTPVTFLDGDLVRRHLSAGLGFSAADRDRNIRRIGWVAAEVAGHGGVAICSPIAPYARTRADVREMVRRRGGRFVLVHVATPLAECERRDRKGLYARARRGEIPDFTGISAPYEAPENPDLRVDTTGADLATIRDAVLALLDPDHEGAPRHDT